MFHTPVECCTEKKIRNKQIFHDTSKRKGWDEVVVLCIIFVKRLYSKHGFFTHNYGEGFLLILSAHSSYLLGDHAVQRTILIHPQIVTLNSSIQTLYPRPNTRNPNQRPMDFIFYFNFGGDYTA